MDNFSPELEKFTDELLERCNFPDPKSSERYVCGVSGGADSVALLWLAKSAGLNVAATHVDHGIRNTNEAEFVKTIADKFGTDFSLEVAHIEPGSDLEQRARIERHKLLGPNAMLGHTLDDQAETVLINLIRGAGPAGLAGIQANHRHPILGLRRSETHKLCELLDVVPFSDPSNSDPRFVRNRVRNELLPLIDDISNRDTATLLNRTAERNAEVIRHLDLMANPIDATSTSQLQAADPLVRNHALRNWLRDELNHPPTAAELMRILEVVSHKVIACELSGGRRLARTNGMLRIE